MQVTVSRLQMLLEPELYSYLQKDNYEIKEINAIDLLIGRRFDTAFKLLYLEMKKNKNIEIAKKIYIEHIRSLTLGKFIEPGNCKKNSITIFIETFNKIFESIKTYGFDKTITIIPLAKHNYIENGSHRVASAIYLNKKISCVNIGIDHPPVLDYTFFKNRGVSEQTLDMATTTFVEYAENIYIAFIFTVTNLNDSDIQNLISNIVYQKNINLNFNGMCNLISQIYFNEAWLNNTSAIAEAVGRFETKGILKTVVFQENSLEDVIKIKTKIRSLFNLGNNSIHITDTQEEARRMARIIFNNNSIHFLNYGKPNTYEIFNKKLDPYKKFIYENNINTKDIILDTGTVIAAYGLRNSNDIDYFLNNSDKLYSINNKYGCNSHDEELIYHNKTKEKLIYDQRNFFYFNEIKFISFDQVWKMKKNRMNNKDIKDIKLMNTLIENTFIRKKISIVIYNFMFLRAKIMNFYIIPFAFNLLKNSKLYYPFRKIYRTYIKKHF